MPDQNALIAAATPVFLALIALEAWVSHRRQAGYYALADSMTSMTSMACGVWIVTLEVFIKGSLLLAYGWIEQQWAPVHFPLPPWRPGWCLPWCWTSFITGRTAGRMRSV